MTYSPTQLPVQYHRSRRAVRWQLGFEQVGPDRVPDGIGITSVFIMGTSGTLTVQGMRCTVCGYGAEELIIFREQKKIPSPLDEGIFCKEFGNDLLSHTVARAVPSAQESLTAVFGMGTGGTSPLWSPKNLYLYVCRLSQVTQRIRP